MINIFYIKGNRIKFIDFRRKVVQEYNLDEIDRLKKRGIWIGFNQQLTGCTYYDLSTYKDKPFDYFKLYYNTLDELEVLVKLFNDRKELFKCKIEIVKKFNLPKRFLNYTLSKIAEHILEPTPNKKDNLLFVPLLKLKKYKYVKEFFEKSNRDNLEVIVAGVEHNFSRGGVHGALKKVDIEGDIIYIDVKAFYTSLLNIHHFNVKMDMEKLHYIHNKNLTLKGDDRIPYKLLDNSIVGNFKNKNSSFYNLTAFNSITVNGQLLILMLIELIEEHVRLIQTNTDGLIVELTGDFDELDDIVTYWEMVTGLKCKFEYYDRIIQKDVNNYILIGDKHVFKGFDNRYKIVNKAIENYFKGISVEDTINNADTNDFALVISDKCEHYKIGSKIYDTNVIRVFALENGETLYKYMNGSYERVANIPSCGLRGRLDKKWYIEQVYKRLEGFGIVV